MIRFVRTVVVALLILAWSHDTAHSAVSADVTKLPYRREIENAAHERGPETWTEITEDSVLARKSQADFTDVRFMNEAGESMPYASVVPRLTDIRYFHYRTLAGGWTVSSGTEEIVVDLGDDHPNLLYLDIAGGSDDPTLNITASADRKEWSYVSRESGPPVYRPDRMTAPDPGHHLRFPERYLKLERPERHGGSSAAIRILRYEYHPAPQEALEFTVVRSTFRDHTWQADIEFKGPPRYVGALVLDVPRPTPAAWPIRIEADAGSSRRYVNIEEAPDWTSGLTDTLTFTPVRTSVLRLTVEGADPPNAPFTVTGARAIPWRWRLPAGPDRLWIAYGDAFLTARSWQMEMRAERALEVIPAAFGPEERNPLHVEPGFGLEWLKRRPAILSVVMVVLLAVVALLTFRRRTPAVMALLFLVSCAGKSPREPMTVLAAASLADVLPRVGKAWEKANHAAPRFTFDATSRLARQIEEGAPADLFFSADEAWMDELQKENKIDPQTRIDLLGNDLVLILPNEPAVEITGPAGLTAGGILRIGIADESVPAGRYARAALDSLGLRVALAERLVNGSNVRTVLAWTVRGEVDAGIVYATDARGEPRVSTAFTFPGSTHPPIVYPAAIVAASKRSAEARQFLEFCRTPGARTIFETAGFRVP